MNVFTINRLISKNAFKLEILYFPYIRICTNNRSYSKYYNIVPRPKNAFGPGEFDKYQSQFEDLVKYLTSFDQVVCQEAINYFKEILHYNVPGHEQAAGPLVVLAYKYFTLSEQQTTESVRLACTVGWAYDMFVNSVQITDDILDSSQTRINKPCWYTNEDVGLKAIQHSATIGEGALMILTQFLVGHPNYIPILQFTQDMKFKLALAQTSDMMIEKQFKFFTKERYRMHVMYKGSYPTIIYPIRTGMYLAGVSDQKLHSEVTAILSKLGFYFTVQNDILDCYGKPEITGKYGSDIQSGKITWLAVQALTDADSFQTELFKKHYGKSDILSQKIIYDLYEKLEILEKFLIFEKESYYEIEDMIDRTSKLIPKKLIKHIVNAFYGKNNNADFLK